VFHLAGHPDDRRDLLADPSLVPGAIEEFLRYYAPVAPGRKVTRDTELGGCPMKAGQMLYLPLAAANRDPAVFPAADRVDIRRQPNPHIAFGAGVHHCVGSHLARLEIEVALQEWHRRIPDYRIEPGARLAEHGGEFGLEALPLVWGPTEPGPDGTP